MPSDWPMMETRLPPNVAERVNEEAAKAGLSRYAYLARLICKEVAPDQLQMVMSTEKRTNRPQVDTGRKIKCDHPRKERQYRGWGSFCGLCKERL